jgi:hypothetical protein
VVRVGASPATVRERPALWASIAGIASINVPHTFDSGDSANAPTTGVEGLELCDRRMVGHPAKK